LSAKDFIIDGELVYLTDNARTDFQRLQNALAESDPECLAFYAFDVLYLNGHDHRTTPLIDRKRLLHTLLKDVEDSRVRESQYVVGSGPSFFQQACDFNLEGIVSKKLSAPYQHSRSPNWVKVKCSRRQEFVIGGYTDPG